ncbi:MAG: tRNA preQ1(34) S-adenosylmethionine ribosyltransferase-isomerase QueA [Dehalococcoidia bacterium]|nr:tRNA preQ1(34) S-adenosylmethionine ribosyltransferase-isomerase QueA [Dehalococcoidia bacterium]
MRTADFDYDLPPERIAQSPIEPRDNSRLMVLHRETGLLEHRRFFELVDYLKPGDVLVLNESRVIPARFTGHKQNGGARIEILLLNRMQPGVWETLVNPGRRIREGALIEIHSQNHQNRILAEVLSKTEFGTALLRFDREDLLEKLGEVPLPPYIHTPIEDPERYQTVYAKTKGSVAAPTAGLHFTPPLIDRIKTKGVEIVFVTLHVGLGSFRPVKVTDPREHSLHQEYFEVGPDAARRVNSAKKEGRRIIAVGTTAVRSLERATQPDGTVQPFTGWNDLYILPGYRFQTIDALITNFHLPRSTLLMLVAAFSGTEPILRAYGEAVRLDYRFFSFGDAMLIL